MAFSEKEFDAALNEIFPDPATLTSRGILPAPVNPSEASSRVAPLLSRWYNDAHIAAVSNLLAQGSNSGESTSVN